MATSAGKTLTLVVAMGRNRAIGVDGGMPWHLPAELRHFRATTMGHPVVMGRRTWEAVGRPLPGRQNIVVTRDPDYHAEGAAVAHSLAEAVALARGDEVMIIGGGELYRQALAHASRLVVTVVDVAPEADTWFPEWEASAWREVTRRHQPVAADNPLAFTVSEWERTTPAPPVPGTPPDPPA